MILWTHADDAMRPLKRISVSFLRVHLATSRAPLVLEERLLIMNQLLNEKSLKIANHILGSRIIMTLCLVIANL